MPNFGQKAEFSLMVRAPSQRQRRRRLEGHIQIKGGIQAFKDGDSLPELFGVAKAPACFQVNHSHFKRHAYLLSLIERPSPPFLDRLGPAGQPFVSAAQQLGGPAVRSTAGRP